MVPNFPSTRLIVDILTSVFNIRYLFQGPTKDNGYEECGTGMVPEKAPLTA